MMNAENVANSLKPVFRRSYTKFLLFLSSVQKEFAFERQAVKDFVETDPLLRRFFEVFVFEAFRGLGSSCR